MSGPTVIYSSERSQIIQLGDISEDLCNQFKTLLEYCKTFKYSIVRYHGKQAEQVIDRVNQIWDSKIYDIKLIWMHALSYRKSPSSTEMRYSSLSSETQRLLTEQYCHLDSDKLEQEWVFVLDLLVSFTDICLGDIEWIKTFIRNWKFNREEVFDLWKSAILFHVTSSTNKTQVPKSANYHGTDKTKQALHESTGPAVDALFANDKTHNSDLLTDRNPWETRNVGERKNNIPAWSAGSDTYKHVAGRTYIAKAWSGSPPKERHRADNTYQQFEDEREQSSRAWEASHTVGTTDSYKPQNLPYDKTGSHPDTNFDNDTRKRSPITSCTITKTQTGHEHTREKAKNAPKDSEKGIELEGQIRMILKTNDQLKLDLSNIKTERDQLEDLFDKSNNACKALRARTKELEEKIRKTDDYQETDLCNARKDIAKKDEELKTLQHCVMTLKETIKAHQEERKQTARERQAQSEIINQLNREKSTLMDQLSATMNRQMARDETDLENINVKNRPMKILEEYEQFCSQQWLDAKVAIDDNAEYANPHDPLAESERCALLCSVLLESYRRAEKIYKLHKRKLSEVVQQLALDPLSIQSREQTFSARSGVFALDKDMEVSLSKALKQTSDKADFSQLAQEVLKVVFEGKVASSELDRRIAGSYPLQAYVSSALSLCWRMVIQQPPMTMDALSLLGKPMPDVQAEPHFGSTDPKKPTAFVQYYVYPAIWHGGSQMKKARVFLGDKVAEVKKETPHSVYNSKYPGAYSQGSFR